VLARRDRAPTTLSSEAQRLLEALPADGAMVGNIRLRTVLSFTEHEYQEASLSLRESGLVRVGMGRGGSIGIELKANQTTAPSSSTPPSPSPATSLSPQARFVLSELPADGTLVSNIRLRSTVDIENEAYTKAVQELKASGVVRFGPGRGGSIGRRVAAPAADPELTSEPSEAPSNGAATESQANVADFVPRESDLYQPFVEWLKSTFQEPARFAHAKVTATPRGRARDSGQWSRPDVTAVQVRGFEWLPDIEIEVSSYEIKRAADTADLAGVYEAAAHGRAAHRASLVLEGDARAQGVEERVLDEARHFGLGLYVIKLHADSQLDVEEIVHPQPQSPGPAEVDQLLAYFLRSEHHLRDRYRAAIGR
jgi:hypothetical protein